MNFYALSGLLTFLTSFGFGIFSWIKGAKRLNKIWAVFCFCVAIWGLGCWGFSSVMNQKAVFLWLRIGHIGVVLMPAFFLHFIFEFLEQKNPKTLFLVYSLGGIFSLINLTDHFGLTALLIAHLRFVFNEFYVDSPPAPLYPLFLCYYFGIIIYAHYCAFKSYKKADALKKNQLKYFLFATVVGFAGGATSFFMVFGLDIYPTLHITVPLYPVIMTYAIVNYKLMDIEVIIKKTLVFAGIVAAAVLVIALPFALLQAVIGKALGIPDPLILMALGIATAVLIYRPVERYLVNITDRYLFQRKYNYHRLLKENSKQLSLIKSLDEMAKQVVVFLVKQGRIRNAGIFVQSQDQEYFELKYSLGYGGRAHRPYLSLENTHPIIRVLAHRKIPLVREQLEREIQSHTSSSKMELQEVLKAMKGLKAEVIIPSFLGMPSNNQKEDKRGDFQLRNLLILGPKKSDVDYTDEDLDVFFTIAQDSAIAAENARLFDDVLKEREAKIKAEDTARRVHYAETLGHEMKNKLAMSVLTAKNIMERTVPNLRNIHEKYLTGKIADDLSKAMQTLYDQVYKSSQELKAHLDVMKIITKTAQSHLSSDDQVFEEVYVKMVWEDTVKELNVNGINIQFIGPQDRNFFIWGNPIQLQQVFRNLLQNSIDAMADQESKSITLECSFRDIGHDRVGYMVYTNNGPDIPPEMLDIIFDKDTTTKQKPKGSDSLDSGSGYGMFVCREIIEMAHKGKIDIDKRYTGGARFVFWLPTKDDK